MTRPNITTRHLREMYLQHAELGKRVMWHEPHPYEDNFIKSEKRSPLKETVFLSALFRKFVSQG